jgi:hypothetical protein
MKKANSLIVIATLIICFPFLTQPSTKDAEVCPQRYQKILVLGAGTDSSLLLKMEDQLTSRLQHLGYIAVSAIRQYGPDGFKNIRDEEPLKQLYPYDAVMTITLLNTNETCCMPESDSTKFFWEYYADKYERIHAPGYSTEKGKYYWEANLFELCNWQLKYSMRTHPFVSTLTQPLMPQNGDLIMEAMIKNNIIKEPLKPF